MSHLLQQFLVAFNVIAGTYLVSQRQQIKQREHNWQAQTNNQPTCSSIGSITIEKASGPQFILVYNEESEEDQQPGQVRDKDTDNLDYLGSLPEPTGNYGGLGDHVHGGEVGGDGDEGEVVGPGEAHADRLRKLDH